jgi:hypothetical protein
MRSQDRRQGTHRCHSEIYHNKLNF